MTVHAFRWQLHWPTTLFVAVLLPCLLGLGFWQLRRADEKALLQQQSDALQTAVPLSGAQLTEATPTYTRVAVQGEFDNSHSFLLDNRVLHGRVGYEVLTPLRIPDGAVLWVNRGWVAGDPARRSLPSVPTVSAASSVHGYVYRDIDNRMIGAAEADMRWPRVIEQIDVTAMDRAARIDSYSYVLRLDADSPAALTAAWPVVTSSPQKHVGYAVQWFAMVAVLALLWLWRSSNLRELLGRGPAQ